MSGEQKQLDLCWELAGSFLGRHPHLDTVDRTEKLAMLILHTIEKYMKFEIDNYEPDLDPIPE